MIDSWHPTYTHGRTYKYSTQGAKFPFSPRNHTTKIAKMKMTKRRVSQQLHQQQPYWTETQHLLVVRSKQHYHDQQKYMHELNEHSSSNFCQRLSDAGTNIRMDILTPLWYNCYETMRAPEYRTVQGKSRSSLTRSVITDKMCW